MNPEQMKQNLSDAGCRSERITEIMTLCERGHVPEAIQKMKSEIRAESRFADKKEEIQHV